VPRSGRCAERSAAISGDLFVIDIIRGNAKFSGGQVGVLATVYNLANKKTPINCIFWPTCRCVGPLYLRRGADGFLMCEKPWLRQP